MQLINQMKSVKAFAPATVANVCCGFDILGFAVDAPGDEVKVTWRKDSEIKVKSILGDGGKLPYEADKNTASVAIISFLKELDSNQGVDIELIKNLPLGSGMGSSAASGVAALVAINHLMGNPLTRDQLIPHAMEAERIACGAAHADNVAPSLLGGFVLVRDYNSLDVIKIEAVENLYCTLVHPHLELKTEDLRKVLKHSVTLKDAITQSGNIAGLMIGLLKPDYPLISRSLKDVIAEPMRSVFIPGFSNMRQIAMDAGALGFGISGSGPTVFALSENEVQARQAGEAIQSEFLRHQLNTDLYVSKVNQEGAKVLTVD
jgi:homoserine kinase